LINVDARSVESGRDDGTETIWRRGHGTAMRVNTKRRRNSHSNAGCSDFNQGGCQGETRQTDNQEWKRAV
jgi:hypothetical protein